MKNQTRLTLICSNAIDYNQMPCTFVGPPVVRGQLPVEQYLADNNDCCFSHVVGKRAKNLHASFCQKTNDRNTAVITLRKSKSQPLYDRLVSVSLNIHLTYKYDAP